MDKSNYKYYSGHHSNINKLHQSVSNYRHATVLDRFAFFSINSNFILPNKNEEEGWFCIEYKSIGEMTGYKERTIKAIVKLFTKLGLIEKVRRIIKNQCRSCIRITQKTKDILGLQKSCVQTAKVLPTNQESCAQEDDERKNLAQQCTFKSAENALAYNEYREKEKDINIITRVPRNEKQGKLYNVPKSVTEIFSKIGERLQDTQKTTIWGAICNLQKQHGKNISNASEYVAWVSFSIINAKHQLKKAFNFSHQLNCLMKIARSAQGLQKPRGFHNHWDVGQELKTNEMERLKQHEASKQEEQGANSIQSIEISGLENSSDIGYVVAKKANELWSDHGSLKDLKQKKGMLLNTINSLINEIKGLPLIYKSHPEMMSQLTDQAQNELENFKVEYEFVCQHIKKLNGEKQLSKELEWQPLYQAVTS